MSDEYTKARDAEGFKGACKSRSPIVYEHGFTEGADWGRAWESPAVKQLRRVAGHFANKDLDFGTKGDLLSLQAAMLNAVNAYDAEREGQEKL